MIYNYQQIWILTLFFAIIIKSVNVQFAMPMPMPYMGPMFPAPPPPPPIFPMPAPIPFIFPIQIAPGGSDESKSNGNEKTMTTTTTTTTSKPDLPIALAMPIPMPVPMAMPAMPAIPAMPAVPAMPAAPALPAYPPPTFCQGPPPRPRNCPPCPPCTCKPSCTPSFFSYCSPCHLKCRCKRVEDAPQPLPPKEPIVGPPLAVGHILAPPPVVIVPFPPIHPPMPPPRRRPKKKKTKYSSCSDESTDYTSSDSDYLRRGKRKIIHFLRRNPRSSESENELVKPMLSYISENGDIKFETKISNDDVAELLGEDRHSDHGRYPTVQVLTTDDESNKPQVMIFSKDKKDKRGKSGRTKHKRILLRGGISNQVLDDGKKQLIFRPADNKKISNLSVSFQIA